MVYRDRFEAGRRLAERLRVFQSEDPMVLALPRGGVQTGFEIARVLGAPLDVLVVRKLGAPGNPEFGIGAIAPGGIRVLDDVAIRMVGVSSEELEATTAHELIELDRRLRKYRGDRPAVHVTGRTVILADDGLATGVTARAAIRSLKIQNPGRVVLAVPVAPADTVDALRAEVNQLVCLDTPPNFRAVGQFYEDFSQVSDEEVLELLERAQQHAGHQAGAAGA